MLNSRILNCLGILAFSALTQAQAPPTTYTITEAGGDAANPITTTVYRNGSKALMDVRMTASRSLTLYDLKAGTSYSWDPADKPIACSAGTFSGDWGDPFGMTAELSGNIAKGEMKQTGAETVSGIPTKVYEGGEEPSHVKAWLDSKDGLVMLAKYGPANGPMVTLVDIRKVNFAAPPASLFVVPAACASVHPPPAPADLIATETGDSAANYVNAIYGPGTKNSCSIVLRVVHAGTMAPITKKFQVAIDTTYNQDDPIPPHYVYGMGTDGSQTYSGGGVREITNQIRNGMVRINNPPAYFNLSVNLMKPGTGASLGLIYRQCFAPTTVLLYVVKDPDNPSAGGDWLWAKAGKYATIPAAH
jgi:hypothetical protein